MIKIKEVNFDFIFEIWSQHLWPNRKSKICPVSSVGYNHNKCLYEDKSPYFYGAFLDEECIGVNSCIKTGDQEFRSRGLWVFPEHRKKGVSKLLLNEAINYAKCVRNGKMIWSLPRKTSIFAYLSVGYVQTTNFFNEGVEFGPNCFVKIDLLEG
jgi:GNAT superfamily N-acetyltransferase